MKRRRISSSTLSSPQTNERVRAMESGGRVSPGASASKSPSTRSAQSASHAATIRRSASLSVCGELTLGVSQAADDRLHQRDRTSAQDSDGDQAITPVRSAPAMALAPKAPSATDEPTLILCQGLRAGPSPVFAVVALDELRVPCPPVRSLLRFGVAEATHGDVRLPRRSARCASRTTRGCRRKREKSLRAASLWMLAEEPDVDPARVPEATGAPIRRHRRRDRNRLDGVGDQPSPSR